MSFVISIHAPLAGRDISAKPCPIKHKHFNPRAPCGARLYHVTFHGQSHVISIHAPLAGRDCATNAQTNNTSHFNPRAPCGARLSRLWRVRYMLAFQSTRPLRGATQFVP